MGIPVVFSPVGSPAVYARASERGYAAIFPITPVKRPAPMSNVSTPTHVRARREPSREGRSTDVRSCGGMIGTPWVATAVTGDRAPRKAETAGNLGTELAARSRVTTQQFFTTISR
jgi:hypothetical protein